jgi:DNA polymerase III delta subunit
VQNSLFKEYKGVFESEEVQEEKKEKEDSFKKGPNTFALADAFGAKSPKDAWVEYMRLRSGGMEPEFLHAALVGKARDMLASQRAGAEELGIHPFVYKKAKADFKNWGESKLIETYSDLVAAYHESRLGGEPLYTAIEKVLLRL